MNYTRIINLCFSINYQLKERKSETKAISEVARVFVSEDKNKK